MDYDILVTVYIFYTAGQVTLTTGQAIVMQVYDNWTGYTLMTVFDFWIVNFDDRVDDCL